jgi:hypothetical protein
VSYITLIITVPLTIFVALFAVSNTGDVTVGLWPLAQKLTLSSGVFGLLMLGGGFFLGALFVWIHSQKLRFKWWRESRRAARLEKELETLTVKNEKAAAEKPADGPVSPLTGHALALPPAK